MLPSTGSQPQYREQDWAALINAIAAGDQFALHAIFERTHHLVYTLAVRITRSRETAEALTLDVYHDIWQCAADYDPKNGSVLGWIMSQTRTRALDRARSGLHAQFVAQPDVVPASGTDTCYSKDELWAALEALMHEERQTIEAGYFAEMTYAEVAEYSRHPLGTVRHRFRSVLQKLRQVLAEKKITR